MKGCQMYAEYSGLKAMVIGLALGLLLGGCGSRALSPAPVEDRGAGPVSVAPVAIEASPAPVAKPPPGVENAGKPGYYTVRSGDTLIRIGLDHGQSSRDLARWNNLDNPNRIEVGQVLRVAPPAGAAAVAKAVPQSSVSSAPTPALAPLPPSADKPASQAAAAASAPAAPASSAAPAVSPEDDIAWIWPSSGPVLAGFDEVKNKGLDIGGAAGDPVLAAADGRVVYVGAGLRGYGNLIILKHNNTYLTAYAHNQTLLIKEDQTVRKGQKIAEMGSSDADRVKLHFEVRRQGKPVDPSKYLPPR
jgi:lipoprotein NlpD